MFRQKHNRIGRNFTSLGRFRNWIQHLTIDEASPDELKKKKPLGDFSLRGLKIKAAPSYSPTVKTAVPLPQAGLTSEFGMGSGISPPPSAQPNFGFSCLDSLRFVCTRSCTGRTRRSRSLAAQSPICFSFKLKLGVLGKEHK